MYGLSKHRSCASCSLVFRGSRVLRLASFGVKVWAAPLAGGDRGVVLFNRHLNSDGLFQSANLSVSWDHLGLAPTSKVEPQAPTDISSGLNAVSAGTLCHLPLPPSYWRPDQISCIQFAV